MATDDSIERLRIEFEAERVKVDLERHRIRVGFWKFIFGTVALGVLTATINWQIQRKQLDFEIASTENKFIGDFLSHALDKDLERRQDFAEYFAKLSPTQEAQARWDEYRQSVWERISRANEVETEVQKLQKQLDESIQRAAAAHLVAEQAVDEASRKKESLKEARDEERRQLEEEISSAEQRAKEAEKKYAELQEGIVSKAASVNAQRRQLRSLRSIERDSLDVDDSIGASNVASRTNADEWDWTIFLTGTESDLKKVSYVEYTLHRTFPNPVRIVRERGTGPRAFAHSTRGWGTFEVKVRVFYHSGAMKELRHYLRFTDES